MRYFSFLHLLSSPGLSSVTQLYGRWADVGALISQLDILFGNLGEMVEFQLEFLRTLEDGIKLVPDLDRLERVEQFKVPTSLSLLCGASPHESQ